MAKMYIAVTIGPINETLDLTSTPAALWYASSMFSFLTGCLCGEFRRELQGSIISPYYGDGEGDGGITDKGYFADGAGRFHDRIVCAVDTEDEQQLKAQVEQCIERAKKAVCDDIYQQLEYPSDGSAEGYFTIHYIILPAETLAKAGTANAVLGTSDYLDGLELCPAFRPQAPDNSLLKLFAGTEDNHSYYIRRSAMFRAVEPGILTRNERSGNLRSIENIAGYRRGAQWKRQSYFAVVQADGDSMGKILAQKNTDQDVTDFSRQCMAYAGAAAREVLDFGGMPIYAGGDDLLFLAPVVNEEGRTVFSLCRKIGETYSEKLNTDPGGPKTSLSFGVSIQYYKFPLYEALRRARTLLFDHAKSFSLRAGGAPDKNCMAVQLEKHSGQSLALRVDMTSVDALDKLLTSSPSEVEDELLQSVPYHLEQCGKFFEVMDSLPAPSCERYLTFLRNFLSRDDNDPQDTYLQSIAAYYAEQIVTRRCQSADMSEAALDEARGYEPLNTLISVLRLKKFLTERGNEVDE